MLPVSEWDLGRTWLTFPRGDFHGTVMDVEVQKCEQDLDRYREAIGISQPDIVIETGTRAGGSALWFHKEMGLQVVSIDIDPQFRRGQPPYVGPGIEWIRGSSIDPKIVSQVLPLIDGKRVMVSLDSDHHNLHVQAEIALWGPLVTPGGYLVVEDACFDLFDRAGQPEWARVGGAKIPEYGGALMAIERQLDQGQTQFWRDEELEKASPVSHSPCGWWRRHD